MGSGISQVCAQAGIDVVLNDVSDDALARAREGIAWSVGRFIEKGKLEEDQQTIMERIALIMVNRDVAGFVINRINFSSAIEAMNLVEAGVATVEDIDMGLRLASGRRMGIFETGDMVGLDVTCGAMMAMYQETGDQRFYPPLLLRRKVKAGHLGRKTGKGWYTYDENGERR